MQSTSLVLRKVRECDAMRIVRRIFQLDRSQARLLVSAFIHLFRAWREFRCRPLKEIIGDLQRKDLFADTKAAKGGTVSPVDLGWAITVAARYAPWRSDCLVQAIAASRWLQQLGHLPTLRIGFSRDDQAVMEAHAWITLDGAVIVGGRDEALAKWTGVLDLTDSV